MIRRKRRRGGKQREREERGRDENTICEERTRRGDNIREQADKLKKAHLDMNLKDD